MQLRDMVRTVSMDGVDITLSIGDVVWYFGAAQVNDRPIPATIQAFGEDAMVDLMYNEQNTGKPVVAKGICMLTDTKLEKEVHRKRGAWCARGAWSCLDIKG